MKVPKILDNHTISCVFFVHRWLGFLLKVQNVDGELFYSII